MPESLSEAETPNLSTPSPISLVFASRITPGNQSFAVLFPFNRRGLIVSIRWLSCYLFCFHSSSWSRRCEAQWAGRLGKQQASFVYILFSFFIGTSLDWLSIFHVVKSQRRSESNTQKGKEWIAYMKAVCTLHDSSSFFLLRLGNTSSYDSGNRGERHSWNSFLSRSLLLRAFAFFSLSPPISASSFFPKRIWCIKSPVFSCLLFFLGSILYEITTFKS